MTDMRKALLSALLLFSLSSLFAGTTPGSEKAIQWLSWEEAVEKSQTEKRLILVDLYTDWCGWCKKMDKTTYSDEQIADYINKNFYAVKLNAEQRESITFKGQEFKFVPSGRNGYHQLAAGLVDNQLSYPTTVFLNGDFERITVVPGFLQPVQMDQILKYFAEGYPDVTFEDFQAKQNG